MDYKIEKVYSLYQRTFVNTFVGSDYNFISEGDSGNLAIHKDIDTINKKLNDYHDKNCDHCEIQKQIDLKRKYFSEELNKRLFNSVYDKIIELNNFENHLKYESELENFECIREKLYIEQVFALITEETESFTKYLILGKYKDQITVDK